MQWRALTLLIAGMGVIYLASLLQDAPYPHPAKMKTYDRIHFTGPDTTLLFVQPDYVYEYIIYYGQPHNEHIVSGTGDMKTGVFGNVKLIRKPLPSFLQPSTGDTSNEDWTVVLEHTLRGHVTNVAGPPSTKDSPLQFAVLYHMIENESPRYYVRVYYYAEDTLQFEHKDLLLPGTTWIKSISLEANCILFSRDPDIYQYRVITLPKDLTREPHSENARDIILSESEPGHRIAPNTPLTDSMEKHCHTLSQLYSPNSATLRVLSLDIYKTRSKFHFIATILDNATTVTQLSDLRGEPSSFMWQIRQTDRWKDSYNEDDFLDNNGVLDLPQSSEHRGRMPHLSLARSTNAKTVAFPVKRTQFTTIDYTDRIDVLSQRTDNKHNYQLYKNSEGMILPEYYYWPMDELRDIYDVYHGDISGLEINEEGNLLVVWTERNFVYIYKRGTADDHVAHINEEYSNAHQGEQLDKATNTLSSTPSPSILPTKSLSLVDQLDVLLGIRPQLPSDEQLQHHSELPFRWHLRMMVTPNDINSKQTRISTVAFFNASSSIHNHTGNNYILVALKTGGVYSYVIDAMETPQTIGLGSFVTGQWDMLIAMCVIIAVFVFNEYQHYGGVN